MVSEKLGAAFIEVGADLGPLEKSLGSIPGMMQHAGTNITGGLKSSLQGGDFSAVGKQLGNQLVTGMSSQFGMLGQAAGTFATALGPAGVALLGIGASIAVIGVGLGKCVSSAATWQTLMVDVQKVTNTTEAGFSKLSSDLLAIRGETGASMESIAGAAAGAGRMGIDPDEIADYTSTILKMSSAWGMSADATSESIGKIGSVVKPAEMAWTEFGNRMGSTINDLADSMATDEESIVTGMKKVSAQMAMLKPDPSQLSAWAALIGQLQAFGMTSETSGESLKDALNYMMRDTGDISGMIGMDPTAFQEAIREDAIGTIQELAVAISELPIEEQGAALAKFGATGGQMMGMLVGKVDPVTKEIEGLNAALATGASAWEDASSLNEQYAKSQETLNAQIDIFKGKISVAATSIGTVLLPFLTDVMGTVNQLTDAFIDLGDRAWDWLTGSEDKPGMIDKAAGWIEGDFLDFLTGKEDFLAKSKEAGKDIGAATTEGVNEGTSEIPANLEEIIESTDGAGAGETVGASFTDRLKAVIESGVSEEIAPMIAAGLSDAAAVAMYNAGMGETPYSEAILGEHELTMEGGTPIKVQGVKDVNAKNFVFRVTLADGSVREFETAFGVEEYLSELGFDELEQDIAWRKALGDEKNIIKADAMAVKLEAEVKPELTWDMAETGINLDKYVEELNADIEKRTQESLDRQDIEIEAKAKIELEQLEIQEGEWLSEVVGGLNNYLAAEMESMGEMSAQYYSDGLTRSEANDIIAEAVFLDEFRRENPILWAQMADEGMDAYITEIVANQDNIEKIGEIVGKFAGTEALAEQAAAVNEAANAWYNYGEVIDGAREATESFAEYQEKPENEMFFGSYVGKTSGYGGFLESEAGRGAIHPGYTIPVTADTTAASGQLAAIEARIEETKITPIDIDVGAAKAKATDFKNYVALPITIPIHLDFTQANAEFAKAMTAMEAKISNAYVNRRVGGP